MEKVGYFVFLVKNEYRGCFFDVWVCFIVCLFDRYVFFMGCLFDLCVILLGCLCYLCVFFIGCFCDWCVFLWYDYVIKIYDIELFIKVN